MKSNMVYTHAFYLVSKKRFMVIRQKISPEYAKYKYDSDDCYYIGSRSTKNLSNMFRCYSTDEEGIYFANDVSARDLASFLYLEYEDIWNIIHGLYIR